MFDRSALVQAVAVGVVSAASFTALPTLAQCSGVPTGSATAGSSPSDVPQFTTEDETAFGVGPVQGNESFGLISARGYLAVNRDWEWVDYPYEGSIRAVENGLTGFTSLQGQWQIDPQYVYADRFQEGFAVVGDGEKFGFINQQGDELIPIRLDGALRFQEGFAAVQVGERVGFIDIRGEVLVKPQFASARSFHEGMAAFRAPAASEGGPQVVGYLNKSGKIAWQDSSGKIESLGDFNESLAPIQVGEQWGFLSKRFKIEIEPTFEAVRDFTNGVAAAKQDGKWGYIDKRGRWMIDPVYLDADDFDGTYAMVKTGDGWGYIDKRGRWLVDPQFAYAEPYFRNHARVSASPNFGYLNLRGKVMWDPGKAGVKPGESELEQKPWMTTERAGLQMDNASPLGPYPADHLYIEELPTPQKQAGQGDTPYRYSTPEGE